MSEIVESGTVVTGVSWVGNPEELPHVDSPLISTLQTQGATVPGGSNSESVLSDLV